MNRREILKYTAMLTGSAVCTPLVSTILSGCTNIQKEVVDNDKPEFFDEQQFKQLKVILDKILPETDSPSATEVGVHQTIDSFINAVYREDEKEVYAANYSELFNYLDNKDFWNKDDKGSLEILSSLEESGYDQPSARTFIELKQQVIAFYLSNEIIAEQYLNYLPVPGDYKPCISLSDVGGKAWAI